MKKKFTLLVIFGILSLCRCNDKPEAYISSNILSVYPNPCLHDGYVNVNNSGSQSAALRVFDTKGEIILKESVPTGQHNFRVQLGGKPNGTYHVVLGINNTVLTKKLIKI